MRVKCYYRTVSMMVSGHEEVRGRYTCRLPQLLSPPPSGMPFCTLGTGKLRTTFPSSCAVPIPMKLASAKQKQRLKDLEPGCKYLRYLKTTGYCCHCLCWQARLWRLFWAFSGSSACLSPRLPGHRADMDLGRGSVNPELRIVAAPPLFSGFLTIAEAAIPWGPGLHC